MAVPHSTSLEDNTPRDHGTTIATELRQALRGTVWTDGGAGYDQARTVWNGAVDRRPAVVARCAHADGALTRSSPMSLLAVHQFHGAATRVAPDATAFALRQPHLLAEVIGAWTPGEATEPHLSWVESATAALAPDAIPGGYPNILGPADAERVRLGFGANLDRLRAVKRRYDPDHTFTAIAALDS